MGYTTSTVHGIEVPDSAEPNDTPEDIGKVVTALEGGSIVKRLTSAAIAALTAPQKPAGLVVYNTTTNKVQISDGTNFADLDATAVSALGIANAALPKAGGTMSGAIAMGSNKVTGLAKGTATGEAIARQQIQSGLSAAITESTYGMIMFGTAFGATPTVLINLHGDAGAPNIDGHRFWTSNESTTGFRINNYTGITAAFTWIAVGN